MRDTQNITILLLLVTAGILTAILAAAYVQTSLPVSADALSRSGNYIVTTGQFNQSLDLIYVINLAARKLNVYFADARTRSLELLDSVDLEQVFSQQ